MIVNSTEQMASCNNVFKSGHSDIQYVSVAKVLFLN